MKRLDRELSEAIGLLLGVDVNAFPEEDEARVIARYGKPRGAELARRAAEILDELDGIEPDWERHDLASATQAAVAKIGADHPELEASALDALGWAYSWGYK